MKALTAIFVGLAMLTACTSAPVQQAQDSPQTDIKTEISTQAAAETAETAVTSEKPQDNGNYTEDINLSVNKKELTAYEDSGEVIFAAEVPVDCNPEKLTLIDADTGKTEAELFDEADYEKYGDTIKGDSVYNCRFTVNTDINTNDETSEKAAYHYYAVFADDKGEHRSNTVEIQVFERFTDKELNDMETVDNAITELISAPDYKDLTVPERRERALALLNKLADEGLVIRESIYAGENDDNISFEYSCDISGGIMLKDFDPNFN